MKILSGSQIREADQFTIIHEPIASIDLMERAAQSCAQWITERFDQQFEFKIICGTGNNGGDGLAIARLLLQQQYLVKVFCIHTSAERSPDFLINYDRLKATIDIVEVNDVEALNNHFHVGQHSVVVDAILGTGLNKPVEGLFADIIDLVNSKKTEIISIDIPSGLYADALNASGDKIIQADYTLTFQAPKLSFMFPETADCVGEISVLDIKLSKAFIDGCVTHHYFITKEDISAFLKKKNKFSHKGNFGHALLAAGSYGKMGAAVLAARACLRSGVGLLTVHTPACGCEILQTAVPEAMVDPDSGVYFISDAIQVGKYNAIGLGPGISTEKQTQQALKQLLERNSLPLVIDADAINILAENKEWLSLIPAGSIFTPHPKEFERLAGKSVNAIDRLQRQRDFAFNYKAYVILKGAHTTICCPDGRIFFNSTGNPGMATGGSGDVLTGIITSLLAQHYNPEQACVLGVYLHGLAGDYTAENLTEESMIASDIVEHLPAAFDYLHS